MSQDTELGPCPKCGKREGKLMDVGRGKFRFYVICGACSHMTPVARTEGIAAKLWNEAKPAKEKSARSGRRGGKRAGQLAPERTKAIPD